MRGFHGYLGAGLKSKGLTWEKFGLAESTWKRIRKDPRYKNHQPKAAKALSAMEDLKIAELGRKTFKLTVSHLILMINAQMGTRGQTPYNLRNQDVDFESDRKVFGV